MNNDIFVFYLGDGIHSVNGVPARDLTRAEWEQLPEPARDVALAVTPALYELADDAASNDDELVSTHGEFSL